MAPVSSYYTMGDRKYPELATYFDNITATMSSVAALADTRTVVVQMVAFSDAGLAAAALSRNHGGGWPERGASCRRLKVERDGRLWRSVPGRRWYSDQRGETPGSQEVVLFHRKAAKSVRAFGEFLRKCQAERHDNPADARAAAPRIFFRHASSLFFHSSASSWPFSSSPIAISAKPYLNTNSTAAPLPAWTQMLGLCQEAASPY